MSQSKIKTPYQTERHALGKRVSEFTANALPSKATPGKLICLDLFAGAGGFSTALTRAARANGFEVDLSIVNHWSVALDTARANLGNVRVFNSAIQDLDPREVVPGRYVDIMVCSPECIMFSAARGAKPINDQRRSTAAEVLRFLEDLHVDTMVLENVSELETWGDLDPVTQRPIKEKKGRFFKAFIKAIKRLGYSVEYRHIVASDFGDATTRKRLFLIAQKNRLASFPMQTHSKNGKVPGTMPWVPARAIIDFSIKGLSIFDRAVPHVTKTLKRIRIGFADQVERTPLAAAYVEAISRFQEAAEMYYGQVDALPSKKSLGRDLTKAERDFVKEVKAAAQQQHRLLVEEAFRTPVAVLTWEDLLLHQNVEPMLEGEKHLAMGAMNMVNPIITKLYGTGTTSEVDEPLDTVTAGGVNFGLAKPLPDNFLVTVNHGDTTSTAGRHASIDEPLNTITTKGSQGLVSAFCLRANASDTSAWDDAVTDLDAPLRTVTTKNNLSVVAPEISVANSEGSAAVQATSQNGTVSAQPVGPEPFIASYYGPKGDRDRKPRSVDEPLATQTSANRFGLVEPHCVAAGQVEPVLVSQHYGFDNANPSLDEPMVTASTRGAGYIASPVVSAAETAEALNGLVRPAVINMKGQSTATEVDAPLPTQTAHAPHLYVAEPSVAGVEPFICSRNQQEVDHHNRTHSLDEPMLTATASGAGYLTQPTLKNVDPVIIPQQRGAGVIYDSLDRPVRGITCKNGTGIATPTTDTSTMDIDLSNVEPGKPYIIVSGSVLSLDVLYRMLNSRELAKAMSFVTDEHEYSFGNAPQASRVRMVGNAVAVKTATALITHALQHRFAERRETMMAA